jgi:predicted outer membrane repeat protein
VVFARWHQEVGVGHDSSELVFFKSSAAEHSGGAIAGMAMADSFTVVVDVSAGVVVGGRSTGTVKETKIFFCVLAYPLASRDPSVCCAEMCLALHLLLYWPTCDELWRKVRVCLVLFSPTARSRLDRRLQVSVF